MDFRNNSIPLEKVTSFDVNKTIQRSLTKAVARHGLGLYVYAGEDLPEDENAQVEQAPVKPKGSYKDASVEKPDYNTKKATAKQVEILLKLYEGKEDKLQNLLDMYKVNGLNDFTMAQASEIIGKLTAKKEGK